MDILKAQKKEINNTLIEKDIGKVAFLATGDINVVSGGKKLILEKGKKYTIIEQDADEKDKEDDEEEDKEKKDKEDEVETKESKKRKAEKKCKEEDGDEVDKEDDEEDGDEKETDKEDDEEEEEDKKVEKKAKKVKESVITSVDKVCGYLVGDASFVIRKEDGSEMEVIGEDGEYVELYPNSVDDSNNMIDDMDLGMDTSMDYSTETEIEDTTFDF